MIAAKHIKNIFIFALLILLSPVNAEIVIEKLEDPPYLNPDGTTYTVEDNMENSKDISMADDTSISIGQLSKLERKIFGRNFAGDARLNRLSRLEQRVFGAVQRGESSTRLKKLNTATKSFANNYSTVYDNYNRRYYPGYNNQYNNPYNIYSPYRPYRRTGLREFFKVFTGGALTGFTPPATSTFDANNFNNQYSPYYNQYSGFNNQGQYYTTTSRSNSNFMDLFSNGASGSEMYYDDGQYRRNLNSTGGGCGVQIIY